MTNDIEVPLQRRAARPHPQRDRGLTAHPPPPCSQYSEKYMDDLFEYRHVILSKQIAKAISLGVEPKIVTSWGGTRICCCQCGVLFDNRSRVCG